MLVIPTWNTSMTFYLYQIRKRIKFINIRIAVSVALNGLMLIWTNYVSSEVNGIVKIIFEGKIVKKF